jgi:hypothetical protein
MGHFQEHVDGSNDLDVLKTFTLLDYIHKIISWDIKVKK